MYNVRTDLAVESREIYKHRYNREIDGTIYIDDKIKAAIADYYTKYGV